MMFWKTKKGFLGSAFVVAMIISMTVMAQEIPMVPSFDKMLAWGPARDRSMVVAFDGVKFKYEILDWHESNDCKTVVKAENNELKWITHVGYFSHEYRTKDKPIAYQFAGDKLWRWVGKKTYKEE